MLIHSSGAIPDFLILNEEGSKKSEKILASLPYAMYGNASKDLFDTLAHCGATTLVYYRIDWSLPFDTRILRDYGSEKIVFKGIQEYLHAKVIWWQGWGVYIGSSNLTDRACFENFEAGVFLSDEEIVGSGLDVQLFAFFRELDECSIQTSDKLLTMLDEQNGILSEFRNMRNAISERFTVDFQKIFS